MTQRLLSFLQSRSGHFFLGLTIGLLSIKVLGKILHEAVRLDLGAFGDPSWLSPLVLTILVHAVLLILAYRWSRILAIPASFIFLILPFFFYFIMLVNSLLFRWSDQLVLYVVLGLLILGACFHGRKVALKDRDVPRAWFEGWMYWLIGIFVLQGVLLFLSLNFRVDRVPFADENSFWFSAAKEMLEKGFLAAHQAGYPGGGLHPLGVPFLNALPGILFQSSFQAIPFCMPIYIILGLTVVLLEFVSTLRSPWGLLFFLTAWFASFNNRSWSGMLVYSMVYGESVCMVMVLSLLGWLTLKKQASVRPSWGVMAFLLGLLVFTKFPLILFSVAFLVAFIMEKTDGVRSLNRSLGMVAIFFLPFALLKLFQMKFGGTISSMEHMSFDRLLSPNVDMLRRVIENITLDAGNLWYYFWVAAGVLLFAYQQWSQGWPVLLWVSFLVVYYAYIFSYGSVGGGDAASGLRYFLPAVAGFFYLATHGAVRLFDAIQKQRDQWSRLILYLACSVLILYKLF